MTTFSIGTERWTRSSSLERLPWACKHTDIFKTFHLFCIASLSGHTKYLQTASVEHFTLPSSFFQYCLHRIPTMTASSSSIMPARHPIRIAVLLLSSLATGSPALGVTAANSSPVTKIMEEKSIHIYRRKRVYIFTGPFRHYEWTQSICAVRRCLFLSPLRYAMQREDQ